MGAPLAVAGDVVTVYRPLTPDETTQVTSLIVVASAKLRQSAGYDVDGRLALFSTNPDDPWALDPVIVANVIATVVKRFLVNVDGVASQSLTAGPYGKTETFVNRYDKTGSDVRGAIQIIDSDLDQLKAAPTPGPLGSIRTRPRMRRVLEQDLSDGYVL